MLRVGLTGGIGAGKSTVAAALADLGAVVIDADAISREVVAPGTDGLAEVVAAFGGDVLDDDGALDRPALGRVVFADDEKRARLNGIVHPRVGARTAELVAQAPADAVVVHDVPLLVENGLGPAYALVIVVDAPVEVRVARLAESRGMSEDDARSRIAAQADDDARREAADVWIANGGERDAVRREVERLWRERVVPFEANVRAARPAPAPTAVVDPDPTWPRQAQRLAARVRTAAGELVERVEHVGPTAVPGLAAPDVIDLVAVPAAGADRDRLEATLAAMGLPGEKGAQDAHHASADPGRAARLWLRSAGSARELVDVRAGALADPGRVRAAPEEVRAAVRVT